MTPATITGLSEPLREDLARDVGHRRAGKNEERRRTGAILSPDMSGLRMGDDFNFGIRVEPLRSLGEMRQCLFDLFFGILVIGEFARQVFLVSRHVEVAVAA